jgi:hypothetical protein
VTESFEELLESLPAIELALRREREAQATR